MGEPVWYISTTLARERTMGLSMIPVRKMRSISCAAVPEGSPLRFSITCCMAGGEHTNTSGHETTTTTIFCIRQWQLKQGIYFCESRKLHQCRNFFFLRLNLVWLLPDQVQSQIARWSRLSPVISYSTRGVINGPSSSNSVRDWLLAAASLWSLC